MPTSTVIRLFPVEDVRLPPTMGHYVHAVFLDIVRQVDPALAEHLHTGSEVKPFTLSPLQGRFESTGEKWRILIREGQECWFRVTLLDDALFAPFSRFFLERMEIPTLRLGSGQFHLIHLSTSGTGDDARWSGHATYDELWESTLPSRTLSIRFYSPTAFKMRDICRKTSKTSMNLAVPDPVRCVQSWATKWNTFSGMPVDKDRLLRFVDRYCQSVETSIQTKMTDFKYYKELGFVGTCRWTFVEQAPRDDETTRDPDLPAFWLEDETTDWPPELMEPIDEALLRRVNVLANFAFYCGTGYKTTMGLGQTKLIAQ
jgi:CRISPR-associated endoribonuclease Cas6